MTDAAQATHGLRYNEGKPRIDLVTPSLMLAVAKVSEVGAKKYAPRNWQKGMEYSKVYASLSRHLLAWWGGADVDAETGLSHLWHVAWNAMALVEYERRVANGSLPATLDDRYPDPAPTPMATPDAPRALSLTSPWLQGVPMNAPDDILQDALDRMFHAHEAMRAEGRYPNTLAALQVETE